MVSQHVVLPTASAAVRCQSQRQQGTHSHDGRVKLQLRGSGEQSQGSSSEWLPRTVGKKWDRESFVQARAFFLRHFSTSELSESIAASTPASRRPHAARGGKRPPARPKYSSGRGRGRFRVSEGLGFKNV